MLVSALGLLLTLAATALRIPSIHAIQCAVGTLIPNAAGQVDLTTNGVNNFIMSYTCSTESTGCVTAFMRQGFTTDEASRLVVVSCQSATCESASEVIAPNHWYDIRCCTSDNCNREGLNNIDWGDRTPTINTGGFPTFPSLPTFSVPTGTTTSQPDATDIPTDAPPTTDPLTPTQPAGTQPPASGTILPTQAPTGSSQTTTSPTTSPVPISGSTGPTTTIPISTSTGIHNVAFITAGFNPLVIFIPVVVSFAMSF